MVWPSLQHWRSPRRKVRLSPAVDRRRRARSSGWQDQARLTQSPRRSPQRPFAPERLQLQPSTDPVLHPRPVPHGLPEPAQFQLRARPKRRLQESAYRADRFRTKHLLLLKLRRVVLSKLLLNCLPYCSLLPDINEPSIVRIIGEYFRMKTAIIFSSFEIAGPVDRKSASVNPFECVVTACKSRTIGASGSGL